MKYTFQNNCPCGDYEFTITYYSDNGKAEEFYCPFCSVLIEDEINVKDEDEYLDDE